MLFSDDLKFEVGKKYIFASHPHGIHTWGMGAFQYQGADHPFFDKFPFLRDKMVCFCASILFYVPFVRDIILAFGFRDASRETVRAALRQGNSVVLVVGGAAESLLALPGTDKLVILGPKRKGFVRMALQEGAALIPVYTFHNTDTYHTFHWFWSLRKWLVTRHQVCLPLFVGRWGTAMPVNVYLPIAVGSPLPLPKDIPLDARGGVPDSVVDAYHAQYVAAVQALFERYKADAGYPPERKLELFES